MELVVAVDVVALVCDWLRDGLDVNGWPDIHVATLVPSARPSEFVIVARTGGPRRDVVVDDAQITVDSWAATDADAHDLSQMCRALMFALAGRVVDGTKIYVLSEFAGPALLADIVSDQPRYRASYQVPARCAVQTTGS